MTDTTDATTPDLLDGKTQPPVFDLDVDRDAAWPQPEPFVWKPREPSLSERVMDLVMGRA